MIIKKSSFILDHINSEPISRGLKIVKKQVKDGAITIAYIFWNEKSETCYIQTVSNNFQTQVVEYDDFKIFIYLVDEAYRLVTLTNENRKRSE